MGVGPNEGGQMSGGYISGTKKGYRLFLGSRPPPYVILKENVLIGAQVFGKAKNYKPKKCVGKKQKESTTIDFIHT